MVQIIGYLHLSKYGYCMKGEICMYIKKQNIKKQEIQRKMMNQKFESKIKINHHMFAQMNRSQRLWIIGAGKKDLTFLIKIIIMFEMKLRTED